MPKLAAQLYTLREFTQTPADIAKTLKRVREMGFTAVQASAMGPIEPKEFANILKDEGLACCATHVSVDRMRDNAKAVIDEHHLWGCKYTALGGYWPKDPTAAEWIAFAKNYNEIAKNFVGSGLRIGYHNHNHEFAKFDGKTAMAILFDTLTPDIFFEIDTYWVTAGGGDPAAWIRKVAGRIPCVHLKDMGIRVPKEQYMMEVGEGNLDWPGILSACKSADVEWYIVEQDTCYRDPFESLKISYKNLSAMGLS